MNQLVIWLDHLQLDIHLARRAPVADWATEWGLVPELEDQLRAALAGDARPRLRVVAG